MLVDVVVIGDLIYDIYEDEQGNRIKLYSDYVRQEKKKHGRKSLFNR